MKNLLLVAGLALAAGAGLGAALGYYEADPLPDNLAKHAAELREQQAADANGEEAAPMPKAVIDGSTYNFDRMERGSKRNHEFHIQNEGDAPLTVAFLSHTCKCTEVLLNGAEVQVEHGVKVAPGDEAVVKLEWVAKTPAGPFRHGATFSTNDPRESRLELIVEGQVVESSTLTPAHLYFGNARIGEKSSQHLVVSAFLEDQVQIVEHEVVTSPPSVAEHMQVR
ncbi:MAG: DUF1573 domain-containing protein, partial [Planctomycetales bacterium]|nr:DUF1573 domain-containing protein [Planctomycetales bacterium]